MQPLKITLRKLPLFSDVEDEAVRLLLDKAMSGFHRWQDVELKFNCTQAYLALVPDFPATLLCLALMYICAYFPDISCSHQNTLHVARFTKREGNW